MSTIGLLSSAAAVVLALEVFEFFAVRKEGSQIFSMKLGWRFFYFSLIVCLLFSSIYLFSASHRDPNGAPLWWILILLAAALLTRPRTLVANSGGLASYGWYGFRRRFIPWADVSAVTSDWEERRLAHGIGSLWVFMGYKVAVAGRDGTRIEHTIQMPRQGAFLDDLRRHIPPTAFAPGLFDWHP
ncbi:MAG TPA: hypothetical protein VEG64_04595 [Candidatus Sulfotelmatobacter sp.]|nr:hypothetical protein [Candidatus Sulfotelmatobacter sp.]